MGIKKFKPLNYIVIRHYKNKNYYNEYKEIIGIVPGYVEQEDIEDPVYEELETDDYEIWYEFVSLGDFFKSMFKNMKFEL